MATKTINELQLISSVTDSVNIPGDNALQTYRITAPQWQTYFQNNFKKNVTSETTTASVGVNTNVVLATTASAWTLSLHTAVGYTGKIIEIKKTSNDVNALTIDPNSSETIDGDATTTINTINESIKIVSNGSNWIILERNIPSQRSAYTPVFTGFGTPSSVNFVSYRLGRYLFVEGTFTPGTTTATEARISLGFNGTEGNVSTTSDLPTLQLVGAMKQGAALSSTDFQDRQVFAEASKGYVTFGASYSTYSNGLLKGNGNGVAASSTAQSLHFRVPISGWKG